MALPLRASDFPGISQNGLAFLQTLVNELNNHVHTETSHTHGGVTTGAGSTSAATATMGASSGTAAVALDSSVSAIPAT